MIYKEILEEAIQLVGGTRNKDYGDRLTNHQHIAGLWSIFLGKKISPHDVATVSYTHLTLPTNREV